MTTAVRDRLTESVSTARKLGVLRRERSGRKTNVSGWPKRRSKMARLFLAAAELLRKPNGWVQGYYATQVGYDAGGEPEMGYCLVGAICSLDPLETYGVPEEFALEALSQTLPRSGLSYEPDDEVSPEQHITDWNDHEGRQKRTVIKALERAAERN